MDRAKQCELSSRQILLLRAFFQRSKIVKISLTLRIFSNILSDNWKTKNIDLRNTIKRTFQNLDKRKDIFHPLIIVILSLRSIRKLEDEDEACFCSSQYHHSNKNSKMPVNRRKFHLTIVDRVNRSIRMIQQIACTFLHTQFSL